MESTRGDLHNGIYTMESTRWNLPRESTRWNLHDETYTMEFTRRNLHDGIYTIESTRRNLHDGIHTMRFQNGHKSHDILEHHGSHKCHGDDDGHKSYNGEIYVGKIAYLQATLRNPSKLPI